MKYWVICLTIFLYLVLHSSPLLSLKTHLVLIGHPKKAFESHVVEVIDTNVQQPDIHHLTVTDPPDNPHPTHFKVSKLGPLYYAEYVGEASDE